MSDNEPVDHKDALDLAAGLSAVAGLGFLVFGGSEKSAALLGIGLALAVGGALLFKSARLRNWIEHVLTLREAEDRTPGKPKRSL